MFHTKAKKILKLRGKENLRLIRRGQFFFIPYRKQNKYHFLSLSGARVKQNFALINSKDVAIVYALLNYRDVADTTDKTSHASNFCETCALGEISKKPVPKLGDSKAIQKLERVYIEVIGSLSPSSICGTRYALSFKDEFSGNAVLKCME